MSLNKWNVQTKNNAKSNYFKQFTVWNGLLSKIKFPDKMKNLTYFQQTKFLLACANIRPFFNITWTNTGARDPFLRPPIVPMKYHNHAMFWGHFLRVGLGLLNSDIHLWLRVVHVGISVVYGRYHTKGAESHYCAHSNYSRTAIAKAMQRRFWFTEGFNACWSSHKLTYSATPPTGGWQEGWETAKNADSYWKTKTNIRMGEKRKHWTAEDRKKCCFQMKVIFSFRGSTGCQDQEGCWAGMSCPFPMRW